MYKNLLDPFSSAFFDILDSLIGKQSKKKNCRFKDKVPNGFNPPPLKLV